MVQILIVECTTNIDFGKLGKCVVGEKYYYRNNDYSHLVMTNKGLWANISNTTLSGRLRPCWTLKNCFVIVDKMYIKNIKEIHNLKLEDLKEMFKNEPNSDYNIDRIINECGNTVISTAPNFIQDDNV